MYQRKIFAVNYTVCLLFSVVRSLRQRWLAPFLFGNKSLAFLQEPGIPKLVVVLRLKISCGKIHNMQVLRRFPAKSASWQLAALLLLELTPFSFRLYLKWMRNKEKNNKSHSRFIFELIGEFKFVSQFKLKIDSYDYKPNIPKGETWDFWFV